MNKIIIGIIVAQIEKFIGKYAEKFNVDVKDNGESGFTITIDVFESLDTVMTGLKNKGINVLNGILGGKKWLYGR